MSIGFSINGLDKFKNELEKAVKKYHDKSGDFLAKQGRKYKKLVISKTPESSVQRRHKLIKSYKVSSVKGYGLNMEVEFYSSSPHFHLAERGHKTISGGWVEGKYMNEKSANEFEEIHGDDVRKFLDECLGEAGK